MRLYFPKSFDYVLTQRVLLDSARLLIFTFVTDFVQVPMNLLKCMIHVNMIWLPSIAGIL